MVKGFFLRLISGFVCAFMMLAAGKSTTGPYNVRDPEGCVLNFTVLSDAHIEGNNFTRYQVFDRCLQNVMKNENGNDAVVFLGDNTMNGQNIENMLFHGTVARRLKGVKVLPAMGNHDIGNGNGDYDTLQNRWYDYTNAFFDLDVSRPYYYEVVDGFFFIVLGQESHEVHEMYVSDAQYTWLADVLAQAENSGKPVFVFCHYPADYAVDEKGNETDRLIDMLALYNETHDIFYFCGHTHMPMYLFWSFHNYNGFPEIYLPRLTELAGADDNEIYQESGVGAEVEVSRTEVTVRARNFYTGEWRYEEDEGAYCEQTYTLKCPIG